MTSVWGGGRCGGACIAGERALPTWELDASARSVFREKPEHCLAVGAVGAGPTAAPPATGNSAATVALHNRIA
jgi:hypothetical protein